MKRDRRFQADRNRCSSCAKPQRSYATADGDWYCASCIAEVLRHYGLKVAS
jgi:ribosomal protein L37AE/L43A